MTALVFGSRHPRAGRSAFRPARTFSFAATGVAPAPRLSPGRASKSGVGVPHTPAPAVQFAGRGDGPSREAGRGICGFRPEGISSPRFVGARLQPHPPSPTVVAGASPSAVAVSPVRSAGRCLLRPPAGRLSLFVTVGGGVNA